MARLCLVFNQNKNGFHYENGFHHLPSYRLPPQIYEKFDVGKVIGDGNFAVVHQCTERKTSQEYALKIIDKNKCRGKEHIIANEVAILRRVRGHSNIVHLYEEFDIGTELYLVMELVKSQISTHHAPVWMSDWVHVPGRGPIRCHSLGLQVRRGRSKQHVTGPRPRCGLPPRAEHRPQRHQAREPAGGRGRPSEAGRLRPGCGGDRAAVHCVRHSHLRGPGDPGRDRVWPEGGCVGRRRHCLHPVVWLPTLYQCQQQPRGAVQSDSGWQLRVHLTLLGPHLQHRQGIHRGTAASGAGPPTLSRPDAPAPLAGP
ncbi:DCLK1, partial [Cordylochernes scorpioides]